MLDLFAPASGSMLVIGVGSFGGRVASAGSANTTSDAAFKALWSVVHLHAAELISTGLDKKLLLNVKDGPFAARSASAAVEAHADIIKHWIAGKSVAFIIGNASERATKLLLPPLAASLRAKDLLVCVVLCEDSFAPESTADNADAAQCQELNADLIVHVPNEYCDGALLEKPVTKLRVEAELRLLRVIETIGGAIAAEIQGTGFSAQQLKAALVGSGALNVSVSTARGRRAVLEAAKTALLNQSTLPDSEPSEGMVVALMMGREVSAAEMKSLAEMIKERSQKAAPTLLGVSVHPLMEDEAFCVLLARAAGSRNVVRLESSLIAR